MRGGEAETCSHFIARPSLLREAAVRVPPLSRSTDELGRDSRPAPAQARCGLRRPAASSPRAPPTYPPANRCTSVSLWLILSSACPPGAEAGRGPSRPPRPAARAKKGDAGEWVEPPLRKATREPTPRGSCSS